MGSVFFFLVCVILSSKIQKLLHFSSLRMCHGHPARNFTEKNMTRINQINDNLGSFLLFFIFVIFLCIIMNEFNFEMNFDVLLI